MKKIGLLLGLASVAFAHTGVHSTGGFMSGLLHPIGGFDHILAMVGVGALAYVVGQKGFISILSFIFCMVLAAVIGYSGVAIIGIEEGILLSIAVIFSLLMVANKIPTIFIASIVGVFGFFHGFAHGTEFATGSFISYIFGFTLSTLALHIVGFAIAYISSQKIVKARV